MNRRASGALAALTCLCWLALASGFAAQAAEPAAPIDLGGEPLPGGDGSTDAPHPTPLAPGLWRSTLTGSYPQYFTYDRRIRDSRVHIGVLGAPRSDDSDAIKVETTVGTEGEDGYDTCGDDHDSTEYGFPQSVLGAAVIVGDEDDDGCRKAGTVTIEVSRGDASATADLPYVIKVVEEAPFTGEVGEPDDAPTYVVPESGTPHEMPGEPSFEGAPLLDASGGAVTVKAAVTEGTELLWRVPVRWGEQPVVRVDIPVAEGADTEALPSYGGVTVSAHLLTPLRERERHTDSSLDVDATGDYAAASDDDSAGGDTLALTGYPVTVANGLLPGDHWVSLSVQPPPDDRAALDVPVELTVELQGEASGGPSYNDAVLSQGNQAGPKGYSKSKPFLVADGTFAAVASGNPRVSEDDGDGWLTGRRWTGLALGVVSALCLGAGVARLRSRH